MNDINDKQLFTSTEKAVEVRVSAPPFVVTETAREVKAIAFAVSTVIAPLGAILMPLTEELRE